MSFTGIGRIGSQHTLTSPQDDTLYLFNGAMWCTHPLLGDDFLGGSEMQLTAGSKIATGSGGTAFTLLCQDIQTNNSPLNKYIAYYNGTSYGVLEVDYVLDDVTLILKYPAFETADIKSTEASLIDYWGTPILKEVEVRSQASAGFAHVALTIANKYSSNTNQLWDVPYTTANEGGLEPMLVTGDGTVLVILKY